jgi:cysteine desulfurase/selenocysteine lyase
LTSGPSKFEAGTPNIIWAVSLLKSLEYIDSIWWMTTVWKHEYELMEYALKKWKVLIDKWLVELVWPQSLKDRVGVFSFVVNSMKNFQLVGEKFAEKNIAVRCWGHCAYPLHKVLDKQWTCRMSMYLYNDKEDVDKFFEVLEKICK